MIEKACKDCKFSEESNREGTYIICRRFPKAHWFQQLHWCWEFKPKKELRRDDRDDRCNGCVREFTDHACAPPTDGYPHCGMFQKQEEE